MKKEHSIAILLVCVIFISLVEAPEGTKGSSNFSDPPTREGEFEMDMNISEAAYASFLGIGPGQNAGYSVAFTGDVNSDGYDDILVGAPANYEGGNAAGKTYLFLGKSSGWAMDTDLNESDASFIGEDDGDQSGRWLSGAGDVNNDGYDDFLIGAPGDEEGGGNNAGQTYLIFGRETGWENDVSLSDANASFLGEDGGDQSGLVLSDAGDVNGDGFDDFLIGAYADEEPAGGSTGQTYLILGKETGWTMDTSLDDSDASFWGESGADWSGTSVSGAGDVNNDGYDDILIGASDNDAGGNAAGQTYLILGKETGWQKDVSLGDSDASFLGEANVDYSGISVSGPGDLNGDGYDDILIGASNNDEGGDNFGQTYVIFGKGSGWAMDTSIDVADASYIGQHSGSWTGRPVKGAGDVNGDGYNDFLIGDSYDDEGGNNAGQTFLIHGKQDGWQRDILLNETEISLIGEKSGDQVGYSVFGGGDVNGDGNDDIIIGAPGNDEGGGAGAGQAYLISIGGFSEPLEVYGIKVTDQVGDDIRMADIGETVIIEMTGLDSNASNIDKARVNVTFASGQFSRTTLGLIETGLNTGVYRSLYKVPLGAQYFDIISISAYIDPSRYATMGVDYRYRPGGVSELKLFSDVDFTRPADIFDLGDTVHIQVQGTDTDPTAANHAFVNSTIFNNDTFRIFTILEETGPHTGVYQGSYRVPLDLDYHTEITVYSCRNSRVALNYEIDTPLILLPKLRTVNAQEDLFLAIEFRNDGYADETWTVNLVQDWLEWEEGTHILKGTPNNNHVGPWDVYVSIFDGKGHFQDMTFQIMVVNSPPKITTTPLDHVKEENAYFCDFNSTDDGQGVIKWTLIGANRWMTIHEESGWLTGTPTNEEVGVWNLSVIVNDGNGGTNSTSFRLRVIDLNIPPVILTNHITTGKEGEKYYRDYEAHDPDNTEDFIWEVNTTADFLEMDPDTGVLQGTPGPFDIGVWNVTVIVSDPGGLSAKQSFKLNIADIDTRPFWVEVPDDITLDYNKFYTFTVIAEDPDIDSFIEYSISSKPESDIKIGAETGIIEWTASVEWFDDEPYILSVTVRVSDGQNFNLHTFRITVIPSEPPTSTILGPDNGGRTPSMTSTLEWKGADPDDDPITYDVYLHKTEAFVTGFREEALYISDITTTKLNVSDLEPGRTYYWTVIPDDGATIGECMSGIRSFKVNYRPTFVTIQPRTTYAGSEFKLKVSCTDQDTEDIPSLRYSLLSAPDGMEINEETGMIRWKPDDDQVDIHEVTVGVSDGIEVASYMFQVEVFEKEEENSGLLLPILIMVIVIILLGVGIFFLFKKKKEMDEQARIAGEKEQEELRKEEEGPQVSYEELYGVPAPLKEEGGMTTRELKDYIHEQIEELGE